MLQKPTLPAFSHLRRGGGVGEVAVLWFPYSHSGMACTKTRNNETKPPKRNHRNHRNETAETSETAETKPAKRPKRNHRNNRNETESETAGTVKRRLWSRSPGNRLADRVCDVTNSRQNPSVLVFKFFSFLF